jgi:hypothetical protein
VARLWVSRGMSTPDPAVDATVASIFTDDRPCVAWEKATVLSQATCFRIRAGGPNMAAPELTA